VIGIELRDSRRLPGPNIFWERPGAVIDADCDEKSKTPLTAAWRAQALRILRTVGWEDEELAERVHPGGVSLCLSAPIDALYAATEVNEWAFAAAVAQLAGETTPDIEAAAERLKAEIAEEVNPPLLFLRDAAAKQGVQFISDDELVSVGIGRGVRTFPVRELPSQDELDWSAIHDIPVAIVTGTNGKSTTVRLVAATARAAGLVAGVSSTDGVHVGGATVEEGDYSGPEGARKVLRNAGVDVAILETARGGLLRRGIGVARADVALITNVDEDHLGESGIANIDALVETKLVVRRAIGPDACLILNADDPNLVARAAELDLPLAWFALSPAPEPIARQIAAGGEAAWLDGESLILQKNGARETVATIPEIPIALGGAARHNIANALAAILVGNRLGIAPAFIASGLRAFTGSPDENPGRGNVFDIGGVRIIVDYAHNPHGFRALFDMAGALPAERRLLLMGQAGDREDEAIRELVRTAWRARPDRIVIKEMPEYLRGRQPGEVRAIIAAEFAALGVAPTTITHADSELAGVRQALAWARPADLLLLTTQAERKEVLALLAQMQAEGWRPGQELPDCVIS